MTLPELEEIVTAIPASYCATFLRRGKRVSCIIEIWAVWDVGEAQGLGVPNQPVVATADEWILLSNLNRYRAHRGVQPPQLVSKQANEKENQPCANSATRNAVAFTRP